jgi:peptidoglycan/LPS O-acetylase OafA/YrhL
MQADIRTLGLIFPWNWSKTSSTPSSPSAHRQQQLLGRPPVPLRGGRRRVFEYLHGVRAIASWWIIIFHVLFFTTMFLNESSVDYTIRDVMKGSYWTEWITLGYGMVDVFFIMTGFLLTYEHFAKAYRQTNADPARQYQINAPQNLSLRAMYWDRFIVRVYPPLITVLLLYCHIFARHGQVSMERVPSPIIHELIDEHHPGETTLPNNCALSPANLLFLNNAIPFGGCAGYTWSLAIQGQVYIVLPWVLSKLGFGRRFWRVWLVVVILSIGSRFAILQFVYENQPPIEQGYFTLHPFTRDHINRMFLWFNLFYSGTPTRIATLLFGVGLAALQACINERDTYRVWLQNNRTRILVVCLVYMAAVSVPVYNTQANSLVSITENALFAVGGPAWGLWICAFFFIVMNKLSVLGRSLDWILSLPFWTPFSVISYWTYLVHPVVITYFAGNVFYPVQLDAETLDSDSAGGAAGDGHLSWLDQNMRHPQRVFRGWIVNCVLYLTITYVMSALLWLFVERPVARWLRQRNPWRTPVHNTNSSTTNKDKTK